MIERLTGLGWGRMFAESRCTPTTGEAWGFDNGAFAAWRSGGPWDAGRWYDRMEDAEERHLQPYLAVYPDVVGDWQATIRSAYRYLFRVPGEWPWYLALQDGARPEDIIPLLGHIAGLFLGGTDRFKLEAEFWCEWAHEHGLRFHYARAGTLNKVDHARRIGADSLDSAFPLWTTERFESFVQHVVDGRPQLQLLEVA